MLTAKQKTDRIAQRIQRLFWVYLSALGLLLISVVASVVLTEMEAAQLTQDAKLINQSGRQRMLSQRIIYLASTYQTAAPADRAETGAALSEAIDTFEAAITLFERSHDDLLVAAGMVPKAAQLFYETPAGSGTSLDARVRAYISNARQVLADPEDIGALERLRRIERGGLLGDLDRVVTAFEEGSNSRVQLLRRVELFSLAFAVLIILFEIAFVFLPGHKLLRRSVEDLEARNAELTRAQVTLQTAHAALERRAEVIEAERQKLNIALEDSEALRQEQAEFTYALSHDLKSPTNTIDLLLAELDHVTEDMGDDEVRELLGHAQASVSRMSTLIHDTLDYSRATHNRSAAEMVDMAGLVEEVLADMRGELKQSGAVLKRGTLEPVFGFRIQLRSLVQNLISNGLKYQDVGAEPRIEISCKRLGPDGPHELRVSDNGIGIAPEDQDKIFGLFKRLHRQTVYPGSGLGLATCQRIALNHGGQIDLTSAPGAGSTFNVTLNLTALDPTIEKEDLVA